MSVAPGRRWLRRAARAVAALALLLVAAVVIAGYTGVPWIDRWADARLKSELSRVLGRPVSVGSVHVSPFGSSVSARDLVVRELPPGRRPVLEVAALSATLALRPLLQGRIEIADLRLEAPRATFFRVGERIEGPLPASGRDGRPPSGGASGLTVVLRRLELIDGVAMFEDTSIPLAGWAEGLLVQWNGDASGNGRGSLDAAHAGSAGARAGGSWPPAGGNGAPHHGRASGQLSADWGSSSRLRADGSLRFPSSAEPGVAGEVKAEVHLEEGGLGRWLTAAAGLEVPVTGMLDGSGLVRFGSEGWGFEGGIRGSGVRFDDFSAESVSADLRASREGIELRRLELDILGGTVSGTGRIEPRKGGSAELALRAEGLALNETLAVIGLESTLEGTGAIEGTVALKLGDPGSLRVRAKVGVTGVARGARAGAAAGPSEARQPARGARVPDRGHGAARYRRPQDPVSLRAAQVRGEHRRRHDRQDARHARAHAGDGGGDRIPRRRFRPARVVPSLGGRGERPPVELGAARGNGDVPGNLPVREGEAGHGQRELRAPGLRLRGDRRRGDHGNGRSGRP